MINALSGVEELLKWRTQEIPLRVKFWNGYQIDLSENPLATISIHRPLALRHLILPSFSSLGEAYVEGDIQVEGSVSDVIKMLERLQPKPMLGLLGRRWKPRRRRKHHDAQAVQHHYDVSNEFYGHWLDRQLVYSCAYFKTGSEDIHQAQEQKLDYICRKLMLKPGERLLDIGCGWGALVRWAVKHYGVKAIGITVSRNQYEFASKMIFEEGLENSCEIQFCDYRDFKDVDGFEKIASIGMFEHVGLDNLPAYFRTISRLMKEGGLVLNHGICSSELDQHYAGHRDCGKFIERYVFPYAELPHVSRVSRELAQQDLELLDIESLRPHYARTLDHWLERLEKNEQLVTKDASPRHYRIWRTYLAGASHAFSQGWISVYQLLFGKRRSLANWPLPLTREYLYRQV